MIYTGNTHLLTSELPCWIVYVLLVEIDLARFVRRQKLNSEMLMKRTMRLRKYPEPNVTAV